MLRDETACRKIVGRTDSAAYKRISGFPCQLGRDWRCAEFVLRLKRTTMKRRAFTLVELLVVIGIIALLAAVLAPMANPRLRQYAKRVALRADLQIIAEAIDAYQHDFGDIPRPDRYTATPFQGGVRDSNLGVGGSGAGGLFRVVGRRGSEGDADGIGFRVRGAPPGAILGAVSS